VLDRLGIFFCSDVDPRHVHLVSFFSFFSLSYPISMYLFLLSFFIVSLQPLLLALVFVLCIPATDLSGGDFAKSMDSGQLMKQKNLFPLNNSGHGVYQKKCSTG